MVLLELQDRRAIALRSGVLDADTILQAAATVNSTLVDVDKKRCGVFDIFSLFDLRMLSGLIGEFLSSAIADLTPHLIKNPNIDGYPDLCDISGPVGQLTMSDFLHFESGGIEVKNTFGLKRAGQHIAPRATRHGLIQPTLVWKAHHPYTNHLLAIQSDFIDQVPQIVSGYFSSELTVDDWTIKQNPSRTSTMTSFCQTKRSAFLKLKQQTIFLASYQER